MNGLKSVGNALYNVGKFVVQALDNHGNRKRALGRGVINIGKAVLTAPLKAAVVIGKAGVHGGTAVLHTAKKCMNVGQKAIRNVRVGNHTSPEKLNEFKRKFTISTRSGLKLSDAFFKAHFKLRDALLYSEKIRWSNFDKVPAISIYYESQYAVYKHPQTGNFNRIDLIEIDESMKKQVEEYMDIADAEIGFRKDQRRSYARGYKGNLLGPTALNKSADIKKLAANFEGLGEEVLSPLLRGAERPQRLKIMESLFFVELFRDELVKKIKIEIDKVQDNPDLQKKYRNLKKRLEELDAYALTLAIAGHIRDDMQVIHDQIEADLGIAKKKKANIRFGFLRKGTKEAMKRAARTEEAYREDVMNMRHLTRLESLIHCTNKNKPMKKESLAEVFCREGVKRLQSKEPNQPKYQPVGFLSSQLFWGMSITEDLGETLKSVTEKVDKKLEVELDEEAFKIPDGYPPGMESKSVQKEYDQKNKAEKLSTDIAAYRKKVFASEAPQQDQPADPFPPGVPLHNDPL